MERITVKKFLFLLILGSAFQSFLFAEDKPTGSPRMVYPERTELDFEGLRIEGEIRNPGDFYFRHRPPEKFGSLIKRRKNFHREMLRDAVMSR